MTTPAVSIVMPFFNPGAYLAEAIDSMLAQDFTDFELLLLNDGSTDDSEALVRRYHDPRIRYLPSDRNRGLVFTLNRGLDEARAPLIARMDGDDIALPQRLRLQVDYMHAHPEADLVAAFVELMDAQGKSMGYWKEEHSHSQPEDIKSYLTTNNCIAHPTVLAKATVIRSLRYRAEQGDAEDYDLWLRWVSAGYSIHKLETVLLRHRILPGSFTRQRQRNVFFKLAATKWNFIRHEMGQGRFNDFVLMSGLMMFADLAQGMGKAVKKLLKAS
jgi:glycosyltransferase involved in cell wall biosynthesis